MASPASLTGGRQQFSGSEAFLQGCGRSSKPPAKQHQAAAAVSCLLMGAVMGEEGWVVPLEEGEGCGCGVYMSCWMPPQLGQSIGTMALQVFYYH